MDALTPEKMNERSAACEMAAEKTRQEREDWIAKKTDEGKKLTSAERIEVAAAETRIQGLLIRRDNWRIAAEAARNTSLLLDGFRLLAQTMGEAQRGRGAA